MQQAQVAQPRDADQIGVRNRVLPGKRRTGMCRLPAVLKPEEISVSGLCLEYPRRRCSTGNLQSWALHSLHITLLGLHTEYTHYIWATGHILHTADNKKRE